MTEFDDELHARLDARADTVTGERDWDDLVLRMTRRSRRVNRALSLALVLTLCASTVAVVVAARREEPAAATKSKGKPAAASHVEATNAAVPTVALSNGQSFSALGAGGAKISLAKPNGPNVPPFVVGGGGLVMVGPDTMNMARVFTRTTADGATVRAYRANVDAGAAQGPPWWTPPGYCYPNAYVQADVSDAAIAGIGFAPLYAEQKDGAKVGGSLSVIGQNEKAVRWVVVAQGPAGAATLRATFPDGSHDEMTPVDGVAVLVGHGSADVQGAKVTLQALDGSGASLGNATISADDAPDPNGFQALCSSPETLPAPGASQPADVAAARAAVTDTFDRAYEKGVNTTNLDSYWDDPHGFADIMAKLRTGAFKEQVETARMKLNDVVFLSPTVAAIQYEIDIPNYGTPSFAPRFNEMHLVGGTWKLARQGFCNDVSLAGVQCP